MVLFSIFDKLTSKGTENKELCQYDYRLIVTSYTHFPYFSILVSYLKFVSIF